MTRKLLISGIAALFVGACGGGSSDAPDEQVTAAAPASEQQAATDTSTSSVQSNASQAMDRPSASSTLVSAPDSFRAEHGIWRGRIQYGRERFDQVLTWTPDGAIWSFSSPTTECRALFDDVWEDDRLRYVADDCPFQTIGDRFIISRDRRDEFFDGFAFVTAGNPVRTLFGLSWPATSIPAKEPEGISLDILGITLGETLAEVEQQAAASSVLAEGKVNEQNTSRPAHMLRSRNNPIQFMNSAMGDFEEDRPSIDYYETWYASDAAGFPVNRVFVSTLESKAPNAVPFYIFRQRQAGMGENVTPAPPAERVREALLEKFGDPSTRSGLGMMEVLTWHYNPAGEQVRESTCLERPLFDINAPTGTLDHNARIKPGCGYKFVATIPRAGEASAQLYSLFDASRVAGPLLYKEFLQRTQPVGPQRDEIIDAFAATKERLDAVEDAPVEL